VGPCNSKILCCVFADEGQGEGEFVVHEKVHYIISPKKSLEVARKQVGVHDWVMRGELPIFSA